MKLKKLILGLTLIATSSVYASESICTLEFDNFSQRYFVEKDGRQVSQMYKSIDTALQIRNEFISSNDCVKSTQADESCSISFNDFRNYYTITKNNYPISQRTAFLNEAIRVQQLMAKEGVCKFFENKKCEINFDTYYDAYEVIIDGKAVVEKRKNIEDTKNDLNKLVSNGICQVAKSSAKCEIQFDSFRNFYYLVKGKEMMSDEHRSYTSISRVRDSLIEAGACAPIFIFEGESRFKDSHISNIDFFNIEDLEEFTCYPEEETTSQEQ